LESLFTVNGVLLIGRVVWKINGSKLFFMENCLLDLLLAICLSGYDIFVIVAQNCVEFSTRTGLR